MKVAKRRKAKAKRPKYSLAQRLSSMPNVGRDEDFSRYQGETRAWDEMAPVGQEFGADLQSVCHPLRQDNDLPGLRN